MADEYKLIMNEFWDISTLAQRLNDTDSIAVEYKTRTGSWNLARFIAKKRDDDGNGCRSQACKYSQNRFPP